MRAYERLLKYVRIHTTSDEDSKETPSTQRQFDLARLLAAELESLGLESVRISESGYVYGMLPATEGHEDRPSIGFIAHMDTSPNASGEQVNPQVLDNYDGGDVPLSSDPEHPIILTVDRFPHLKRLAGQTLITTDGTTLLGADDKAGIAEIVTACETIIREQIPHGRVCVGFTLMKKSAGVPTTLMSLHSVRILPTRWTVASKGSSNTKTSMPRKPP